jgi:transposase
MPRRSGPVHVVTTRRHYKGKVYTSHLLRRTFREDGKVKNETVGNLSHLPSEIIELVRQSLQGRRFVPAEESRFQIFRTWPHGHVAAALGTLRKLGLDRMISSKATRERTLVVAMIVSRILEPVSKLATAHRLDPLTRSSSLGKVLGLGSVTSDELYEALDWLGRRQWRIEKKLAERHLAEGTLLLYDVTSTYLEGRCCSLAALGHSRDGKRDKLQIIIGLLCAADGCPVAVEVFSGNTADPLTLGPAIQKVRERFGLRRVVFVGDRGMLTDARLEEELKGEEGMDWITALRAPAIQALVRSEVLQLSLFDEQDLFEITSPDYPGERLIACRNPMLAEDRARKRGELLAATEWELDKIVQATRRKKNQLRGPDKIGVRVGKVLGRYKMGKHFQYEIMEDGFTYRRDTERIEAETSLDGIYVIRTSVPVEELGRDNTVQAYKDLSRIERAFRALKTVDLEVRPIHHRRSDRVKGHVFLCMLAYFVLWHMKQALAPLLFQDDQPEEGRLRRASVVARARRSEAAEKKIATGLTPDGLPVQDFQSLMRHLATLGLNECCPHGLKQATFEVLTEPTQLQRRAFQLLGISVNVL